MSSAPSKTAGLSISLGLSLFYGVVFLVMYVGTFLLAQWVLRDTIGAKEREIVSERLAEYTAWFKGGRGAELKRRFEGQALLSNELVFVRLLQPGGQSEIYSNQPIARKAPELAKLDSLARDHRIVVATLYSPASETYWTVASSELAEGYVLQTGRVSNSSFEVVDRFRSVFLWSVIPMTLLALLVGAALSYRAVRPIRNLGATVQEILATGNLGKRVAVRQSPGGLGEIAVLFNQLLERNERLIVAMRQSLDNASHDLRTPMTRLRAVAEAALGKRDDGEAAREAIGDCLEESERMLSMLDSLLEVAEADSGAMVLHREEVDLSELIRQVADLYELVAEERKIRIELALPERLPVWADGNRLQQVVANLVDNAVKYEEEGGKVSLTARREDGQAIVTVRDEGIGIPAEDLPRIWDRLYRGDRSRSRRGLGLGLSFVRAIVEAHGGTVEVASEVGRGSTFTVSIPSGRGEEADSGPA